MGLHEITRKLLQYALKVQSPDGGIRIPHHPQSQSIETWGYVFWVWARHYLLTRDESFLHEIYPGILKGMEWEQALVSGDQLGLIPPTTVTDDAYVKDVRQTGEHMWMLIGLRSAVKLAEAMGEVADAERFEAEYKRFWESFENLLKAQTKLSGGYIPTALERSLEGNDWDNLLMLYPELLFEPFDPRVTATIEKTRAEYVEGVLPFGTQRPVGKTTEGFPPISLTGIKKVEGDGFIFHDISFLHYWQTPNNTQNALVRGQAEDQKVAVQDLYALLLHTTSTHAPQEWGAVPWSTRDYYSVHNLLPDGAASAKTIEVLRNMLVREHRNELYLFSALSPAWLQPGKRIEVRDEPTEFGPVSLTSKVNSELAAWNWEINILHRFRQPPNEMVLRIPWFYDVNRVEVDGQVVEVRQGELKLSPDASEVRVRGRIIPGTAEMSFTQTVAQYKQEYRRRFEQYLRTGITRP
jgi:hypothetical protein